MPCTIPGLASYARGAVSVSAITPGRVESRSRGIALPFAGGTGSMWAVIIIVAIIVVLALFLVGIYNGMVRARNREDGENGNQ